MKDMKKKLIMWWEEGKVIVGYDHEDIPMYGIGNGAWIVVFIIAMFILAIWFCIGCILIK